MKQTVLEGFMDSALRYPDNPAIVSSTRTLTYRELDEASNALRNFLIGKGVEKEDLVPFVAERTPELIVGILAIVKAGACYVPIDANYPARRIRQILDECGASVVLTSSKLVDRLTDNHTGEIIAVDAPFESSLVDATARTSVQGKTAAYTIFTSGTTGKPKGVVIEHRSLLNTIHWHNQKFGVAQDCRSTLIAGIGFDVAQWEIWSALTSASALYLPDEETRVRPTALLDYFADNRISHAFVPTVMVSDIVGAPQPRDLRLKFLFTAGEKLNPVDLDAVAYTLVDYYGPTEASIFATYNIVLSATRNPPSTIGRPIADTEIYILDESFTPVSGDGAGELCISGTCLARGYLHAPELTAEKFRSFDAFPGKRMYRTGDLARWLPDGTIQFLGRIDTQIKIRGNRVELEEIEQVMLKHAAVKAAVAAVAESAEVGEKKILAFLVLADAAADRARMTAELRQQLKDTLPEYFLPADYRFIDKVPQNANGKTDRAFLLAGYKTGNAGEPSSTDHLNGREEAIAAIWKVLLRTSQVGAHDNFFDLGGHSLLAAKLVTLLTAQMGVKVFVRDIFEHPTVRGLAQVIDARSGTSLPTVDSEPIRALQDDVELPEGLRFKGTFDPRQITDPREILLTGATGFVGIHLLADLLSTTGATVHCLVRAESADQAIRRIHASLKRYGISLTSSQISRVAAHAGDLAEPRLGLADDQHMALAKMVDVIYHSASSVNFIQPYSYMKRDNVEGLRQVIQFAAKERTKPLILLSTISVYSWGHLHTGKRVMFENDDIDQNLPAVITDIGYVRSKWVMEKVADLAGRHGLPLMTFRLGYATFNSKTGMCASYQWWGRLVKTCIDQGAVPDLRDLREGLTTVDYMTSAIAHISRNPKALGRKFNLIHEPQTNLTLKGFFQLLEQHFGFSFKAVPYHEWLARWEHDSDAPLYPLLSLFKDKMCQDQSTVELYQDTYLWDCSNVKAFLDGSGIEEPRFTHAELSKYLEQSIGYRPPAPAT